MSTNRTKTDDWAYRQAARFLNNAVFAEQYDRISKMAALLRRTEKRGRKQRTGWFPPPPDLQIAGLTISEIIKMKAELAMLRPPPPTASMVREFEKQPKAVEIKPDADGNITFQPGFSMPYVPEPEGGQ